MNLRILKKLSKRAAPLLPLLGDHREQFPARRGENHCDVLIRDRSCWERGRSVHADCISQLERKTPAKDGRGWVWMAPPWHVLKGTVMVGSKTGYEEPEWSEQTAYDALCDAVAIHFTDWFSEDPAPVRDLSTSRLMFAAARDMLAGAHSPQFESHCHDDARG